MAGRKVRDRLHKAIQPLKSRERTGFVFDWDLKLAGRFNEVADSISSHSRDGTALRLPRLPDRNAKSARILFRSYSSVCVCTHVCEGTKMKPREHQHSRTFA